MQRRRWKKVAAQLDAIGVLSQADDGALAAYVMALVRQSRANRKCNREGEYLVVDGVARIAPWAIERHRASQIVRQLAAEFGVTPSSRTNASSTRAAAAAPQPAREVKKEKYFGAQV
jgi:P27 family predicted phage terminase small subunit